MKRLLPGLALASVLSVASYALARAPISPFTLESGLHPLGSSSVAILLGILCANLLPLSARFAAGIRFCSRVILPMGIVLLGARLAFGDLMKVGLSGLLLSVVSISTCAIVMLVLVRLFSLPVKLTTLVGVGTAICGGSAIAAAGPVIDAEEQDIAWSIAAVALLGLVSMFLLPIVGHALGVETTAFGMWAGLTIHQTPQVVAAGLAYGGDAGEVATLIKLVRVTLLAPVVFFLGLFWARSGTGRNASRVCWSKLLPPFVIGFLMMAACRSLGWLDFSVPLLSTETDSVKLLDAARGGDRVALTLAMAAIGLDTRFSSFRRTGLMPLAAGVVAAVAMSAATYFAIQALGVSPLAALVDR